jgi:hypothetical protein
MSEVGTDLSDTLIEHYVAFNDDPDRYMLGTFYKQIISLLTLLVKRFFSFSFIVRFLLITESALEKMAEVQRFLDDFRKKAVLCFVSNTITHTQIHSNLFLSLFIVLFVN